MAKTFEEYKAEAKKQIDSSRNRDIAAINSSADASIKLAEDTYKTAETDTIADYAGDYQRNAVQKLINEKQVAERMANLGLTDSGLNRTQQTAVQLSYANQKGKIDLAKQQELDKLSNDLAACVTEINNQREADKLGINQFYEQKNDTVATELYNTDIEDERKRWETKYNANVKLANAENDVSAFELTDSEIEYCKNVIDEGGTRDDVLAYLAVKNKLPSNDADDDVLDYILGINNEDENESTAIPVNIGTINPDGASKYQKFRIVEDDNFDVKVGDNTYRVENKGKVTDNDTIEKLNKIAANNGEVFLYNGDAYLKYADVYFKLGATNRLFNWGQTPGYQNLLNALQQ